MADEGQTTTAGAPPGAAGADPTMEDILASIRRILNEDEPGAPPSPAVPEGGEPLTLTEAMLVSEPGPEPAAPAAAPPSPSPAPVVPVAAAPPPPVQAVPPTPAQEQPPSMSAETLLAPATAAAATAAVGQLIRAVSQDRAAPVYRSSGPSIEDVVREELRPMLKDWLDQHLPIIVERLVRAEIERVVARAIT